MCETTTLFSPICQKWAFANFLQIAWEKCSWLAHFSTKVPLFNFLVIFVQFWPFFAKNITCKALFESLHSSLLENEPVKSGNSIFGVSRKVPRSAPQGRGVMLISQLVTENLKSPAFLGPTLAGPSGAATFRSRVSAARTGTFTNEALRPHRKSAKPIFGEAALWTHNLVNSKIPRPELFSQDQPGTFPEEFSGLDQSGFGPRPDGTQNSQPPTP